MDSRRFIAVVAIAALIAVAGSPASIASTVGSDLPSLVDDCCCPPSETPAGSIDRACCCEMQLPAAVAPPLPTFDRMRQTDPPVATAVRVERPALLTQSWRSPSPLFHPPDFGGPATYIVHCAFLI